MLIAFDDFKSAAQRMPACVRLSYDDLILRYRRTILGPFWLTLTLSINFLLLTLVFGSIFNEPYSDYVPFLIVSLVFWQFLSSILTESGNVFIDAKGLLESTNLPRSFYAARTIIRHFIIILHNFLVVLAVFIYFEINISWYMLMLFPALFVWIVTSFFCVIIISFAAARFHDVHQFSTAITPIIFLLTPIIWKKAFLQDNQWIVDFNPVFHFFEIVRHPLLGQHIPHLSWAVAIAVMCIFAAIAIFILSRFKYKIQFWI